jgi:hypothetical protein
MMGDWKAFNEKESQNMQLVSSDYFKDRGYSSINVLRDEGSGGREINTTIMLNPEDIRSTKAAFDPAKKDSSNLLASKGAGIAPMGATALAGLVAAGTITPEQAEADSELYDLAQMANDEGDEQLLYEVLNRMEQNSLRYSKPRFQDKRTPAQKRATGTAKATPKSIQRDVANAITKSGILDSTPLGYIAPDPRGLLSLGADYTQGDYTGDAPLRLGLGAMELIPDAALPYMMKPLIGLGIGTGITGSSQQKQNNRLGR